MKRRRLTEEHEWVRFCTIPCQVCPSPAQGTIGRSRDRTRLTLIGLMRILERESIIQKDKVYQ